MRRPGPYARRRSRAVVFSASVRISRTTTLCALQRSHKDEFFRLLRHTEDRKASLQRTQLASGRISIASLGEDLPQGTQQAMGWLSQHPEVLG